MSKRMKPDHIKHSLAVGPKSIQSRVYDRETGELISFVKMPLEETGLVAVKTLLSRDPCAHAKTAIEMIDAMLAEQPAQQKPTCKQNLQVWVISNGKGRGQFSWEPQDERYWTRMEPAQQQEPVAVVSGYYGGQCVVLPTNPAMLFNSGTAFYTSPPASKPLTDEQIMEMYNEPRSDAEMLEFARAIEAAHGIGEQK